MLDAQLIRGRRRTGRFLLRTLIVLAAAWPQSAFAQGRSSGDPPAKPAGRGGDTRPDTKKPKKAKKAAPEKSPPGLPADEKAEEAALAALGPLAKGFRLHRTQHFSVLYNTSEEDLEAFCLAIEKTYRSCERLAERLNVAVVPPKGKLLIHYFSELSEYSGHSERLGLGARSENTPGFYHPASNLSYFYDFRNSDTFKRKRAEAEAKIEQIAAQLKRGGLSAAERRQLSAEMKQARAVLNRVSSLGGGQNESTVQHEVAHQVLWNIGFHHAGSFLANPRWFVEGVAQAFEPISTGKAANIGLVNKERLQAFQVLVKENRLIPLRDFVSSADWFATETKIAYPQSWALFHYLRRTKGEGVKKYIELINRRPADYQPTPERELADFEKAFGRLNDQWVAAWLQWMKNVR